MSDLPDLVTPGQPVEAIWGNDVVNALNAAIATLNGLLPIGMVAAYGGTGQPTNWLLCQGQAVSQTTYTELYAVVQDRFSQGMAAPPAGTFRVPNMQGRFPVGSNVGSPSGGIGGYWSGGGVGEVAGSYDPVMPVHNHPVPDHLHWVDLWSGGVSATHQHQAAYEFDFFVTGFANQIALNRGSPSIGYYLQHNTWEDSNDHAHRTTGWSGASDRDLTAGLAGGGAQVPPGVAFNFIIRAR